MDSVDWLWIGGSNQFALWIHVRVSDLVYQTGETIYSAEHHHETQNKITEDINEKNKPNLILHGLSFQFFGTTKFVLQRLVRKVQNWKLL